MNCHRVQSQLAALSAGQLAPDESAALEDHCTTCPACRREWEAFQDTLLLLSSLSQPLPSAQASAEIWRTCAEHIFVQVEARRTETLPSALPQALTQTSPSWGDLALDWARQQPRWGWAALGSAMVIFGGVWLLAPDGAPQNTLAETHAVGSNLRLITVPQTPGRLNSAPRSAPRAVRFAPPPATASAAVNYHAAMSFDPFVDHVASSLVSSSAEK